MVKFPLRVSAKTNGFLLEVFNADWVGVERVAGHGKKNRRCGGWQKAKKRAIVSGQVLADRFCRSASVGQLQSVSFSREAEVGKLKSGSKSQSKSLAE